MNSRREIWIKDEKCCSNFQKQIKDTFKNKEILIQFVMFPVLALIMEELIHVEGLPRNYFVNMFSSMFVGMAPLVSIAAVISEEKEKNTLRVLMMSGVKPAEYLLGIGSYIWLACMAGAFIMGMTGKYKGREFAVFLMVMGVGILASMLIGAAIGTLSRNQMMATSLMVPVMLVRILVNAVVMAFQMLLAMSEMNPQWWRRCWKSRSRWQSGSC